MPTARCTSCGKIDFAPGTTCKACATPYDDAMQAKVSMAAAAETASAIRTCLKCGHNAPRTNDCAPDACPQCGAIYARALAASAMKAKAAARRTASRKFTAETAIGAAGIVVATMIIIKTFAPASPQPARISTAGKSQPCGDSDARCLGIEAMDKSHAPCTRAIEAFAPVRVRWTDGMLDMRFNTTIGWYEPDQRTIIYTGNRLEVADVSGAWAKHSYFCVWSLNDGMVMKAGIND